MQTTKFLAVVSVVTTLALPLRSIAGPDNEAQAKMREALRQTMQQLNQGTATPAAPPAAPATAPEPAVAQPAPAAEVNVPTVVIPVPVEPAPVHTAVTAAPNHAAFTELPVKSDDATTARLRDALRQTIATQPPAVVVTPPTRPNPPAQPGTRVTMTPPPQYTPTTAPAIPSPFPPAVQQRLAALLQQYKADAITPQEYHSQRAAIIAGQ